MNDIQRTYETFHNFYRKGIRTFGPTPVLLGVAYLLMEMSFRKGELMKMSPTEVEMEQKRLAEKYFVADTDLDKEIETAREWIPFIRKNLKGLPPI